MSDVVIRVEDLSKRYRIGQRKEMNGSFGGAIASLVTRPIRNFGRLRRLSNFSEDGHDPEDIIWALKDVSFEVKTVEVVGIIGPNGSGKSTLLKILTRITEPTQGYAEIHGRVGALLEVGTGFHPELTGRENIYLNGAVLGMMHKEIARKFDEIVDFSGVERFIDTPVKRYSTGMNVRLAFAVAAHLEPEILIVDEVLAVGDAEFQRKCLGKMNDVAQEGRTILFVSHNMAAITTLCDWALCLRNGSVAGTGSPTDTISNYLERDIVKALDVDFGNDDVGDEVTRLLRVRFINEDGSTADTLWVDQPFGIEIIYQIVGEGYRPRPNFLITTQVGEKAFQSLETSNDSLSERGQYRSVATIPANLLNNGGYILTVAITTHNPVHIHCQTEIAFEILDNLNATTRGDYKLQMHGVVRPYLHWETQRLGATANGTQ